jgi:hypothetical protein
MRGDRSRFTSRAESCPVRDEFASARADSYTNPDPDTQADPHAHPTPA